MDSPPVIALDLSAATADIGFSDDEFDADESVLAQLEDEDSEDGASSVRAMLMERTFKDVVHDYSACSLLYHTLEVCSEA